MPLVLDTQTSDVDLPGRLARLRRRVRAMSLSCGGLRVVALAAAFVGLVVIADVTIHLPGPVRAIALVATIVGIAAGIRRWIISPWRAAGDDHNLALQVERQIPGLHDSLASAVQFSDDDVGSPALRAATNQFAVERTHGVEFADFAERQPVVRFFVVLLVVVIAVGMLSGRNTGHGLIRFFDPHGQHPWPTTTLLNVTASDVLARGEPFELHVALEGVPTERLTLSLALERAPAVEQAYPIAPDEKNVRIKLEPARVQRSFKYRVTAGDADTGWRSVVVTVPPELTPLDGLPSPQVRLIYPDYCGLVGQDLPHGTGSIETILGTLVHIRAAADRPIKRASLQWQPGSPQAAASLAALAYANSSLTGMLVEIPVLKSLTVPMPFSLNADQLRFANDFRPMFSGQYEIAFVDAAGLVGRRMLDVKILPDPAPNVVLEQPYTGGEGMDLMPGASFLLQAVVEDVTFAARKVWLEYRTRPNELPRTISIYDGKTLGSALPHLLPWGGLARQRLRPMRLEINQRMSLSQFCSADGKPLSIGDVLTVALVAEDFDDVTPSKSPGRSHEVEIKIVGRDRLEARLNHSRADLARALAELLKLQTDALDLAVGAEQHRRATGQLTADDRSRIARSESLQQQIRERLGDERDGLLAAAERLRQTAADNPGVSPGVHALAGRIVNELSRLGREVVEPIVPLLSSARQELEVVPSIERSTGALPEAVNRQREAERGFRDLLDQMLSGQAVAALAAEAANLAAEQHVLNRQRADLAQKLPPGAEPKSLPGTDQKALAQLKEQQDQLARRADSFAQQLAVQADAATKAADAEHLRSRTLDDAIGDTRDPRKAGELRREAEKAADKADAIRQEAHALTEAKNAISDSDGKRLYEFMNRAAEALGKNRLNESQQHQEKASERLAQVREALRDSGIPEAERLVKESRRAEQQVEKLTKDQESLQERTLAAEKKTDELSKKTQMEELARQQEELIERANDLARNLRREGKNASAREVERASGNMDRARTQLERGQSASSDQDDALERLDDAAEQTGRDRKEAEHRLQSERMLKLADRLKGIGDRHGNYAAEINRLFDAAKLAGGWSRSMQKSLSDVGREQGLLGTEVAELARNHLARFKIVRKLAQQIGEAMSDAAALIEDAKAAGLAKENYDTDREAIRTPQEQARRQLGQLIEAITTTSENAWAQQRSNGETGQPDRNQSNNNKPDDEAIPSLAQFKILRLMQADLNERIVEFDRLCPDSSKLTTVQKVAIGKLRKAQVELVELLSDLTPPPQPTEDKP